MAQGLANQFAVSFPVMISSEIGSAELCSETFELIVEERLIEFRSLRTEAQAQEENPRMAPVEERKDLRKMESKDEPCWFFEALDPGVVKARPTSGLISYMTWFMRNTQSSLELSFNYL